MKTKRLFREDVYQKEGKAKVLKITSERDKKFIILDQTIFFPTGGGQSCDIGFMDDVEITNVFEKDNEIWHEAPELGSEIKEGQEVSMKIDWPRRFDNMQRHCGEHILSGIFYDICGGVNRGFHMGDQYMTIDISLEDDPNFKTMTPEIIKEAELRTNQVIWDNLPVITRHFDTRAEAEGLPLRKKLALEEDITIVSVGSTTNPADCVACCGTHPAYAGQVGMVKIYKFEPNKGMYRIYFEAGKRAFEAYRARFDVLSQLEKDLSAGFEDLMDKYEKRQAKNQEDKDKLYQLSKLISSQEVSSLIEVAKAGEKVVYKKYEVLDIDDLLRIGKDVAEGSDALVLLHHIKTNTVLLFSNATPCGAIVKEHAHPLGAKGGGGKNSARAIFTDEHKTHEFVEKIKEVYA